MTIQTGAFLKPTYLLAKNPSSLTPETEEIYYITEGNRVMTLSTHKNSRSGKGILFVLSWNFAQNSKDKKRDA